MSAHPLNLALRFLLELAALAAYAYWGWTAHEGIQRHLLGIGLPLLAAVLWGTFRVPNDPGNAPVPIPGPLRLLLEAAFFAGAVGLLATVRSTPALVLGVLLVLHYAASYDRVLWLLRGAPGQPGR